MNQQELTQVVDEALERFRGRDLVSSAEVVDVLLDLRLLLLEVESLEQLLDEPAPTAAPAERHCSIGKLWSAWRTPPPGPNCASGAVVGAGSPVSRSSRCCSSQPPASSSSLAVTTPRRRHRPSPRRFRRSPAASPRRTPRPAARRHHQGRRRRRLRSPRCATAHRPRPLSAQTEYTLPRSFLAFDQYQDWLHVYLPTRPNSSTGWIKAVRRHRLATARVPDQGLARRPQGHAAAQRRGPARGAGRHRHRRGPHADGHLLLHRSTRSREPARHRDTGCSPSVSPVTATR